jgi:hypothetical protein
MLDILASPICTKGKLVQILILIPKSSGELENTEQEMGQQQERMKPR